jgi:MFS family permease
MKRPRLRLLEFAERHVYVILFILIMVAAVFYRFYRLDQLPPGLHPDEAANGMDIFRILENKDIRPLYATNGPRESLFFFLQAIFVAIFGNTVVALRYAPAIIGTLAVAVTYFWVRDWFNQRIALISAFLMAVTPWAVTMSRNGYRASMVPLMVPLVLWAYGKAIRGGQMWRFLLAGATLGVGFYTYLSFRLFPIVLVAGLGAAWLWRRDLVVRNIRPLFISLAGTLVVLLPMLAFGVKYPGDVFGARTSTSFLNPEFNNGKPVETLLIVIKDTALMFNIHGDENYRHNLGGQPMLNFFVGMMFILGILIVLRNLKHPKYFVLLAVFGVMLLPEVLTAEGIPHALRAIGVMPVIFVFAALGISYMLNRWYQTFPINSAARSSGLAAMLLLLGLSAYHGYNQYFLAWASSPQTYEAYSEDSVAVSKYLNTTSFNGERILVFDGYSDITVQYLTHNKSQYRRIDPHQIDEIPADNTPRQFLISRTYHQEAVEKLKKKYPKTKIQTEFSNFNNIELFYVAEAAK